MLRKALLIASATALVASPVAAQAADRTASPAKAREDLAGIPTFGLIIAALIVIGAIVIIADDNNEPVSP